MERTIHNIKEWTDTELNTLQEKINLELNRRFMERHEILRERVLEALLDYRNFCGNEWLPFDDNLVHFGKYYELDEIINYFASDHK